MRRSGRTLSLGSWGIAGQWDPRKLLLQRKLKPSGDLRSLIKLPKQFG